MQTMPAMRERISSLTLRRIAATLGRNDADAGYGDGAPLPLGWHTVLCQPLVTRSAMAPDGLPLDDPTLPHHPYEQRLFGGARIWVQENLRVGDDVECRIVPGDFAEKSGSSGPLAVYQFERRYFAGDTLGISETSSVIYRPATRQEASVRADTRRPPAVPEHRADWRTVRTVSIDEIDVFRFSAIMFNSHRIHFDADYTRGVEGLPGILVQAKLLLLHALECVPSRADLRGTVVEYRSHHPAYTVQPLQIEARAAAGETMQLRVVQDSRTCLTITVSRAEP